MFSNDQNQEFLNDEQIRKACPVAFSEKASNEVSKHYTHIPTNQLIDDMRELGWGVIQAQQVAARKNATQGYQKHMIVFRHPDLMVEGQDGQKQLQRWSLEDAADKVGVSKKSLDDYLLQLRFGKKYQFDFEKHRQDKVGVLRTSVKTMKKQEQDAKEKAEPTKKK